jgi:spore maturation protein CgeB
LRIFYAVMRSPNLTALATSNVWHRNLHNGLVALGHEIVEFDFDMAPLLLHADIRDPNNRRFVERERPKLEEALLQQIGAEHRERGVDLFFSYFYDACATPEAIGEIRALGIPTVNFYCNAIHQFDLVRAISPAFDVCMVPERAALPKYQRVGARAVHVQMAADPETYRPFDLPRQFDVTFVGQRYGERPRIIDQLLRHGVDVRVWGPGWRASGLNGGAHPAQRLQRAGRLFKKAVRSPRRTVTTAIERVLERDLNRRIAAVAGPPLTDEEVVQMYSRSKLSLGFSTVNEPVPSGEPSAHMRLRDFEATMSGACYVTGYVDDLPLCFEPDREIVAYRDFDELLDKVRFLLGHSDVAESIRAAGRRRALSDHTWQRRFAQLFTAMGLPARGKLTATASGRPR